MANKIVQIASGEPDISAEEVYIDLDMESQRKRSGKMSLKRSLNIRAVQNSLDNIFRWIPGERIINPEFGSRIRELLYEGITPDNRERVAVEVRRSVELFDPRVNIVGITHVQSERNTENNTVELDIQYTIRGLEDRVFHMQYVLDKRS